MAERTELDVSNRTNNFHTFFEIELLSEEERRNIDELSYMDAVRESMEEIESQNKLWSKFKREKADLFQNILDGLVYKHEEFDPDFANFMQLMRQKKFDEVDEFAASVDLSGREKQLWDGLNPLLNQAFDVLVSWGADPSALRM